MKTNELKPTRSIRTLAKWDELIERYYEGMTTSEEEWQLRDFLFSDRAASPRYDEHRAVMSYMVLKGKYAQEETDSIQEISSLHRKKKIRINSGKWGWAAAALVALCFTTTGIYMNYTSREVYVAYVHGKKYTSPEVVAEETRKSLAAVSMEGFSVEQELSSIFSELEKMENN